MICWHICLSCTQTNAQTVVIANSVSSLLPVCCRAYDELFSLLADIFVTPFFREIEGILERLYWKEYIGGMEIETDRQRERWMDMKRVAIYCVVWRRSNFRWTAKNNMPRVGLGHTDSKLKWNKWAGISEVNSNTSLTCAVPMFQTFSSSKWCMEHKKFNGHINVEKCYMIPCKLVCCSIFVIHSEHHLKFSPHRISNYVVGTVFPNVQFILSDVTRFRTMLNYPQDRISAGLLLLILYARRLIDPWLIRLYLTIQD